MEIRQGNEVVKRLLLMAGGDNSVTLRSGRYEVVIPAEYDTLKVATDSVEILRGTERVARVVYEENGALPPEVAVPGASEPTFSGRTFDEWKSDLQTERNPDELRSAVRAFCRLGQGLRDREAADVILEVMQGVDIPHDMTSLLPDAQLAYAAAQGMRSLDSQHVIAAVVAILPSAEPSVMKFIDIHLVNALGQPPLSKLESQPSSAAAPLHVKMASSQSLRRALTESYDRLTLGLVDFWFRQFQRAQAAEISAGELRILQQTMDGSRGDAFQVRAALALVAQRPSPALARFFADRIEEDWRRAATTFPQPGSWLNRQAELWFGLARLGGHAANEADRTAAWIRSDDAIGRVRGTSVAQVTYVDDSQGTPRNMLLQVRANTLALEVLGGLGSDGTAHLSAVSDVIEELTGQRPEESGTYSFSAVPEEDTAGIVSYSQRTATSAAWSVVSRHAAGAARATRQCSAGMGTHHRKCTDFRRSKPVDFHAEF